MDDNNNHTGPLRCGSTAVAGNGKMVDVETESNSLNRAPQVTRHKGRQQALSRPVKTGSDLGEQLMPLDDADFCDI